MNTRINRHGLQIAAPLHDLVVAEILPGTGIEAEALWRGFAAIVRERSLGAVGWVITVVSGVVLVASTAWRIRQVRRSRGTTAR